MTEGSGAGSTVKTSEPMPRGVIHDRGCRCWPHIEAAAVAQLKADLDAARGEIEALKAHASLDATAVTHLIAESVDLRADLAQARARIEVLTRALERVRDLSYRGNTELHQMIHGAAYRALDAAQAAGAETSCCAQHRPHMSYPTPPAGEMHWVSVPWSWAVRPELQFPPDDDQAAGGDSES